MKQKLEWAIKDLFNVFGIEVRRKATLPVLGNISILFHELKKRGLKCNYFLDIGAHKAEISKLAISHFPEATIYLVEPLQEMKQALENFCKKHPKAKYFGFAVGARSGTQTLNVFNDLSGCGFMDNDVEPEYKQEPRTIEMQTVDGLIESGQMTIPDIAKLDVQGFELEVLKGATKLFGKTEFFILEASFQNRHKSVPLIADVIQFMNERDYVVYDFAGFLRQPEDDALVECDICFVKRDSFLRK